MIISGYMRHLGQSILHFIQIILFAAVMAAFTGCMHTKYQPREGSVKEGYSDEELDDGRVLVEFSPNARTSREKAQDFTVLRACELAIMRGYAWVIVDQWDRGTTESQGRDSVISTGSGLMWVRGSNTTYEFTEMIVRFTNEPEEGTDHNFEALPTWQKLVGKYDLDIDLPVTSGS